MSGHSNLQGQYLPQYFYGEVMVYKWPGVTWFIEWIHQVSVGGKDLAIFFLIYVVKSQLGDPCNCKLLVKDG